MYSQFPLAAKAIFIICLYRIVHCPDPNQSDVVSNSPETPYTSIAEFGSAQTLPEAKISKDMSVQENQILSFPSAQEFSVEDFQRGQEAGTSNDLSNPEADQESSSSSQESTVVATQSLPGEGSSLDTTSGEPIPNQNDLSPQQKAKAYLDTLNCDEKSKLQFIGGLHYFKKKNFEVVNSEDPSVLAQNFFWRVVGCTLELNDKEIDIVMRFKHVLACCDTVNAKTSKMGTQVYLNCPNISKIVWVCHEVYRIQPGYFVIKGTVKFEGSGIIHKKSSLKRPRSEIQDEEPEHKSKRVWFANENDMRLFSGDSYHPTEKVPMFYGPN